MDVTEAELIVRRHLAERDELRAIAAEAARKLLGLNTILHGYVQTFPELEAIVGSTPEPTIASDGSPKGAEAVRIVLMERGGDWLYITELVDALRERDWLPESDNPANAVRAACERLLNTDGSDVHKGRGTSGKIAYSYRPDDDPWDGTIALFNDRPSYGEEPF